MSDFPKTRHELLRARYQRLDKGGKFCSGCNAPIEWWKTTNGHKIPMNPMPTDSSRADSHRSTCPNRKYFKGGDSNTPAEKRSALGPSFDEQLRRLRAESNARVIVMVDDFGTAAFWREGLPAEDLRHDLISAGNFVRAEVNKREATPA